MKGKHVIEVRNLNFSYFKDRLVLCDVNFFVDEGEVVTFLGPNASGKTTLLKIIAKAITGFSGYIEVLGRSLKDFNYRDYSKIVAYVPQEEIVALPFNVYEYLLLGRTPHINLIFVDRKDYLIVENVINLLGIENLRNRLVPELSGGEKQLVKIGRALAQEPRIMLLDEPTSHLDLGNKVRILKLMREMADKNLAIIFTTHDPNEALMISDRVYLLNEGRIVANGIPDEVLSEKLIKEVYKVDVTYMKSSNATAILPVIKGFQS